MEKHFNFPGGAIIDLDVHPEEKEIEITVGDEDCAGYGHMSPEEARKLGSALIEAADEITSKPKSIFITWCPVCGRNDRYTPLRTVHKNKQGRNCTGKPIHVKYEPVMQNPLRSGE